MTVGGWILYVIIAIFVVIVCLGIGAFASDGSLGGVMMGALIGVLLCFPIFLGFHWYYNNTASGARAFKSQESDFNMGIDRRVTVYDMEGDVIKEYEGKFDIEYDDDRILFDDEKGQRHIIYYPTGTVIVDEIG